MIKRFQLFLGPERARNLFLLLAFTGLTSLVLNVFADQYEWVRPVQSGLVLVFVIGAAVIIGGKLDPFERGRMASLMIPAVLAVLIGLFVAPNLLGLFIGAGFGWVIAGIFIFKPRGPMEYQKAVKHMRRSEYADAVKVLDGLIKEEQKPNHYRFRAEILRLWGKLDRAQRDYEKMIKLEPASAVGYNGLAEVLLQSGKYGEAREAAYKAYELAPQEWVAAYNLGMIEDRLQESEAALEHLNLALEAKVPDSRHRLLIHFYRARAFARQGDFAAAEKAADMLKKHRGGLNEWQVILQSDQAETLRQVIAGDIAAAQALADDEMDVQALA